MASSVGGVQNLVVEDGEIQRKTETNGVSWGKLGLGDIRSILLQLASKVVEKASPNFTLYASWAAVAATLRFSPDANSAR